MIRPNALVSFLTCHYCEREIDPERANTVQGHKTCGQCYTCKTGRDFITGRKIGLVQACLAELYLADPTATITEAAIHLHRQLGRKVSSTSVEGALKRLKKLHEVDIEFAAA